jgi:hypothetical protein
MGERPFCPAACLLQYYTKIGGDCYDGYFNDRPGSHYY